MLQKNGIYIKSGQRWTIGRTTQKLVKEVNGLSYNIGNVVEILDDMHHGLIQVRDIETGIRFDVTVRNLGKLKGEYLE